jgi:hypothetical protein
MATSGQPSEAMLAGAQQRLFEYALQLAEACQRAGLMNDVFSRAQVANRKLSLETCAIEYATLKKLSEGGK